MKIMETKIISKSAQKTCVSCHRGGDLENTESGASGITMNPIKNQEADKKCTRQNDAY